MNLAVQIDLYIKENERIACIRSANSDHIMVYVLGAKTKLQEVHFHKGQYLVCSDFDGKQPQAYPIIATYRIQQTPAIVSHDFVDPMHPHWKQNYEALVHAALAEIEKGELAKVVLATSEISPSSKPASEVFEQLCLQNDSNCFYIQVEEGESWIGASPEQLFVKRGHEIEIMALAGTRLSDRKEWGDKEKDEQRVVSDYMEKMLQKHGFTDIESQGPFSRRASSIEHICTLLTGHANQQVNWLEFLVELHPSPALLGLPVDSALKFVSKNEGLERGMFTGYFGIVNEGIADFIVNIRSAKYKNERYELFAGAGINSGSIPEKESEEINQKMRVMRQAIA
jgi:isochorismate synthase